MYSGRVMANAQHARVAFATEERRADGVGVTVVVTLYNYGRFIKNALDSILRQSHPNIELVIVDDASTDDSQTLARNWLEQNGARLAHAKLLAHSTNRGLAQARNTAFESATNEFVFVLDADNEIYPDAIARLLAACRAKNAEAAFSRIEKFGDETGTGGDTWNPARLARGNYIDAMALIRKSAWQKAGGYTQPADIQGWEDYDLWCKFVELGFKGAFVPELLCRYRVHGTSMLNTTTNPNLEQIKVEMTRRHPWLRLDAPPTLREKLGAVIGRLRNGVLARNWRSREESNLRPSV